MRSIFFFFAIALGIGFLLTIGRFLFAIWFVGAVLALSFFAFRRMRGFLARRVYAYDDDDDRSGPLHYWRRPMELPRGQGHMDSLVPGNIRRLERLTEGRVIRVE